MTNKATGAVKVQAPVGGGWQPTTVDQFMVDRLFTAIEHGDVVHRMWLKEALNAFFRGWPIPLPRSAAPGAAEQLAPEVSTASHVMRDGKLVNVWEAAPQAPEVGVEPVTDAQAVRAAHEAGFAGEHWHMGPEELAHLLTLYTASQLSSLKESHEMLLRALAELIACKDIKTRAEALEFAGPNGATGEGWKAEFDRLRADYIKRQPVAWDRARAAIRSAMAAKGGWNG